MSEPPEGKPRIVRKSPLAPSLKLCPKCMKPLQKGSKFGGWLIPQDYYCDKCGYRGVVFLEKSVTNGEGG
jgi:hypothetical protein